MYITLTPYSNSVSPEGSQQLYIAGIHFMQYSILPNAATGQGEGGDFTRPIKTETMGGKKMKTFKLGT